MRDQYSDVVDAISAVARALRRLGMADASTNLGAIEHLSDSIQKSGDRIADALERIAEAIEHHE